MGVESTPAASAKDRSVVESTLKKRTPSNDCCMRRKCGSMRLQELQNRAVMKTTASPLTLSGDVGAVSFADIEEALDSGDYDDDIDDDVFIVVLDAWSSCWAPFASQLPFTPE